RQRPGAGLGPGEVLQDADGPAGLARDGADGPHQAVALLDGVVRGVDADNVGAAEDDALQRLRVPGRGTDRGDDLGRPGSAWLTHPAGPPRPTRAGGAVLLSRRRGIDNTTHHPDWVAPRRPGRRPHDT